MWYFMSMVIFNRLTMLFRITSYSSWLRNGNKLFLTGAQICWIYNQELSLKLRFLGMGVYIRHRRGNSACAEILTPPQDGGEGVKFSRSPLITFDDFRDHPRPSSPPPPPPPPCLHFPSKFECPPSEPFQSFQRFPLNFGFSVTTDPPFCSPKNQVIPPKILRPLPPGDK